MNLAKRNRMIFEGIRKGDLTVGDLIQDGGYLPPEEEPKFLVKIYENSDFLQAVRREEMSSPKRKISKVGIAGNFLHKAPGDGVALEAEKRSKVFTDYIELETEELLGSMYMTYQTLEDNIEKGNFEETLMNTILPPKIARDMCKVLLQGNTESGDSLLSSMDGVVKLLQTGSNVAAFDQLTGQIDDDFWQDCLDSLPWQYRENDEGIRYILHPSAQDAWYRTIRARQTPAGDNIINAGHYVDYGFRGLPFTKTTFMPSTNLVITDPQNIILGVQRGITIESARDIEARGIIIVVSIRIAIGIEEKDGCVLATGLNPTRTTTTTT